MSWIALFHAFSINRSTVCRQKLLEESMSTHPSASAAAGALLLLALLALLQSGRARLDGGGGRAGGDHEALSSLVGHGMGLLRRGVAVRVCGDHKARGESLSGGEPFPLRMVQATHGGVWVWRHRISTIPWIYDMVKRSEKMSNDPTTFAGLANSKTTLQKPKILCRCHIWNSRVGARRDRSIHRGGGVLVGHDVRGYWLWQFLSQTLKCSGRKETLLCLVTCTWHVYRILKITKFGHTKSFQGKRRGNKRNFSQPLKSSWQTVKWKSGPRA